jgi:hypothetical protein
MDVRAPLDFAQRLMREVWEPFDADAVPRFYRRDVIGHYRKQLLTYDDVVHRLVTDHTRTPTRSTISATSWPTTTSGPSGSSTRRPL